MKFLLSAVLLLLALRIPSPAMPPIEKVFVIVFENRGWAEIHGSTNAPYLNHTLLPQAAYCAAYLARPGLHPSEPNYLWLEAGTNFGILDNNDPATNHVNTSDHLVAQLQAAGVSWRSYQEDIDGMSVPLVGTNLYAPRHNPFVYFDDVTGTNDANNAYGIAHIRPYSELAADLANDTVARYNFITPNLCNDGHDPCPPLYNPVLQSDSWLEAELPRILSSAAFTNRGAVFITWDEAYDNGPVGMIVLSPQARGHGFHNCIPYSHSSLLRTVQQIFSVSPWLGDAANAMDLSDLFVGFRFTDINRHSDGQVELTASLLSPNRTNLVLASPDLANWTPISTNIATTNWFKVCDSAATNFTSRFYRLVELP